MGNFLRENWIWIVAPIVLVAALVALALVLGRIDEGAFVYDIRGS